MTLIEADTALVSWRQPEQPNLAVTHYTILYASQSAWIAGEWQVLQREGMQETVTNFSHILETKVATYVNEDISHPNTFSQNVLEKEDILQNSHSEELGLSGYNINCVHGIECK